MLPQLRDEVGGLRLADYASRSRKANPPYGSSLFHRDRITNTNLTISDHLGIDAAIHMAEVARERGRDFEVALGGLGIDVDGRAADDALDHLQPGLTDRECLADQVELGPGRPALDVEIGAEAQGMHGAPEHGLDGTDAVEIDDRHDLAGDVGEAVVA